jgi:hypothetical protein
MTATFYILHKELEREKSPSVVQFSNVYYHMSFRGNKLSGTMSLLPHKYVFTMLLLVSAEY